MSLTTKLRIRKKLSQLLVGIVIAPLFSFIPTTLAPSFLQAAEAYQRDWVYCSGGGRVRITENNGYLTEAAHGKFPGWPATNGVFCSGTIDVSGYALTHIVMQDAFSAGGSEGVNNIIFPSTLKVLTAPGAFARNSMTSLSLPCSLEQLGGGQSLFSQGHPITTIRLCDNGGTPFQSFNLQNAEASTLFSFGKTPSSTVKVTTFGNNVFKYANSGLVIEYCGTDTYMTNYLNNSNNLATGVTVDCLAKPSAPRNVSGTVANASSVVSWTVPSRVGESAISGYTVTSSPGGLTCTTTTTSCTVTGLTNGIAYTFSAVATNSYGNSRASTASSSVTPAGPPGAPTITGATPGNASTSVSWNAPGSNGGSAITGYTVTSTPGSLTCTSATSPCTVNGLTNGTAYTFTAKATNVVGTSAASAASSSVTPRTVPGAPTGVSGSVGNTSSLVTWTAPGSNGGSAITGYTATSSPGSRTCTATTTSCTVTGLTNGIAYTYTVVATNAAGNSVASSASSSVTAAAPPGPPTSVSATVANASSQISWTAPGSNGGSAITGYTVTSSPAVTAPASCTNTANTSCTFTGLTNGTAYTFSVVAINASGNSTAGTSSSVTPKLTLNQANAPTVAGTSGSTTSLTVTFTSDSSAASTTLKLYSAATGGTLLATQTMATSGHTFTGLVANTQYWVTATSIGNDTSTISGTESARAAATTNRSFAITYSAGVGGSGSAPSTPSTAVSGSTFLTPANTYTKNGFQFAGWSDGTNTYLAGATYPASGTVTGDLQLTAQWTALVPTISGLDKTTPNYGTTVVVTGTNFFGVTSVKIGSNPVTSFTVNSATSLSFTVNSACCNALTITVETPGGSVTSTATITPQPQFPVITTQPVGLPVKVGESVTFSVVASALQDGGTLSYQWVYGTTPISGATSATYTFTPTSVTAAGNYFVFVYNTISGSASSTTSNTAALTLGKATPLLSSFASVSKTYGDNAFTITAPTSSVPGTFVYQSGTTSVATVSGSTITIVRQGSSTITATFTPTNTDDYVSGEAITMTLTVGTKALTVSASNQTANYTGSPVVVANSVTAGSGQFVGSDALSGATYTYSGRGSTTYAASTTAPTAAGTYSITPSAAVFSSGLTSNYSISYVAGELTINSTSQTSLTVTSVTGVFGAPVTLAASGGSGTGSLSYATSTAGCSVSENAPYVLSSTSAQSCSVIATKAADNNFTSISSSATDVVFTAKAITITAGNQSLTYTGSSAVLTNSVSGGSGQIAGTDALSGATYTYAGTGSTSYTPSTTAPTSAGTYSITPSVATWSTGSSGNYSITYAPGTLTISQRLLASPSAPTVTVSTGTLKSFTVTWVGVSNAVAYSLKVYASNGTTLLQTITGLSGTSKLVDAVAFPAISDGTIYKIGMMATGDANNADSPLSELSSLTTNSQYTITYNTTNSTGGTAPSSGTFITGATPYEISANSGSLVRNVFTFSGWNTAADGSGTTYLVAAAISPTSNLVLHPQWTALRFTVTYFGNNNTSGAVPVDGTGYLNATPATVLGVGTLVRDGYNFIGWTTDSANTSSLVAVASTVTINLANIDLYAKWQAITYVVAYNSQGGARVNNGSYATGGSTVLPAGPTYSGYTFNGWFANPSGGSALTSPYFPPSTGTLTLYAQWTPIQYTVTYYGNGSNAGSVPTNSSTYTVGSILTVAGNTATTPLSKTGYTFSGWSDVTEGPGTIYASGTSFLVDAVNVRLYAFWVATPYSVTYNSTSSTSGSVPVDSATYTIGQNVAVRGNLGSLLRTGYTFSGWTDNSSGNGTVYISGNTYAVSAANISFYPKWTANQYTISYDANNASGALAKNSDTYTTGEVGVTLPGNGTLAKPGYSHGGWSLTASGAAVASPLTVIANTYLYAVWNAIPYTVTYVPNGGSSTPTQSSLTIGQSFTLANAITKPDGPDGEKFAFVGWSDGSSTYQPGYNYLVGSSNITLTAQFVRVFTVRYTLNGSTDTPAPDNPQNDGSTITLAAAPSRAGYQFAGWKDQSGQTFQAGASYVVGLLHYLLYAQWNAIPYKVTYNPNGGGTTPTQADRTVGETFTLPAALTRTGHTFSNWSDGVRTYGPGALIAVGTSDLSFTAQWSVDVYTISYDPNGGSGTAISNVLYTYGGTAISLPTVGDLVRTNYTFTGWSETPSGASVGATYTPTMSRTLYAVWTINQYLVTYGGNGGTPSRLSATYIAGSSPLVLPTATRANFTFQGWYSAATSGVLIGIDGENYTPTSATTIYARWIQDSLAGIPESALSFISSFAVNPAITETKTFSTSDSSVSLTVPAGSLPTGTTVTFWSLLTQDQAQARLSGQNNYVVSVVISWINIDGTVPVAPNSNPLVMTVTNSSIKTGARVYGIVGSSIQLLGVATQNGSVTVNFTTDPQFHVLQTKPGVPTNVVATSGDQSSSVVTWSAPADDGGSAIINYTVTASDGQSCISASTTCNFGGLTNGTSYTFTVSATNGVASSDQSTASAAITPGVQVPVVIAPTTPTPATPTPATPTPTTPVTPTPATPTPTTPVTPTAPVAVRAAFVKAQISPQIRKSGDQFICTPGTYTSGYTLDGVIEQGTTSVFTPVSYIYNILFNLVVQSSISVTTSKNSATWDLSLAPAGSLVTCSVTVTNNSLTATESSIQNTAATSAALAGQKQSITTAEAEYKAAQDANAKSYQKALVDNRAKWRADIAKNKATYDAERDRIKKMAASKAKNALTSAALKKYTTAQKKITAEYKASGPAAVLARDLANRSALDAKDAAIAKANSTYASWIESVGYGVLIP